MKRHRSNLEEIRGRIRRSLSIISRYRGYLAKGASAITYPIVIRSAKGCRVWDLDGNEYLDFISSASIANIGHANEEVVNAVREQMRKLIHYIGSYFLTEPMLRLAEKLSHITPGNFKKKAIFGLSGSEAVDMAIKCVRSTRKRKALISFIGSFHGTTCGATAITGATSLMHKGLETLLPGVYFSNFPDCFRCPFDQEYPQCGLLCFEQLEALLDYVVDPGDVAAIFTEPIQGHAGVIIPPKEFMQKLSQLCNRNGIALVLDEIQTGMGRTGKMFACEHFGVIPDVIVLGKALGGGFPISAVVGKADLLDSWETDAEMPSLAAHALSSIAALTTIDVIIEEKLCEAAMRKGEYMLNRLREMMEEYPQIGDVRGLGLMIGVDIVRPGTKDPDARSAHKICWRSWELGLITMPIGKWNNVLRIQPPLNISEEDIDRGLNILEQAFRDLKDNRIPDVSMESWLT